MSSVHRITGVHFLLDGPGAAIWLDEEVDLDPIVAKISKGQEVLGWKTGEIQRHDHGVA